MICLCTHSEYRHHRGVCTADWYNGAAYIRCDCTRYAADQDSLEYHPPDLNHPALTTNIRIALGGLNGAALL